jgi:hypothetical protein
VLVGGLNPELRRGCVCLRLEGFSIDDEAMVRAVVDGVGIAGLGCGTGRRDGLGGGGRRAAGLGSLRGGLVQGSRLRCRCGG